MRPEKSEPRPDPAAPASEPTPAASPAPAPAGPTEPVQEPPDRPLGGTLPGRYHGRRLRLFAVLAVVVVSLAGYGVYWFGWVRGTVSTDDAYVDARIVSVSSRLPGRVQAVPVQEGATVERDQVLVQLGQGQMLIRRRQARADLARADARLALIRNGTRLEEIAVAHAESHLREVELQGREAILKRMESLAPVTSMGMQQLDTERVLLERARAELGVSEARVELMLAGAREEEIAQAEAERVAAQSLLDDVEADLADLTVRAPVAGVVARRMVDPGEYVEGGQGLVQVVETGKTWVVANLEEGDLEEVRPGNLAEVEVDAYPGRVLRGKVGSVYSATLSRFSILSTTSTSGSFIKVTQRVPVRIEWAEDQLPPMYPGFNVVVRIHVRE